MMAGYGTQMKMDKATKPCYNVCGACGTEIASTEILCKECIIGECNERNHADEGILWEWLRGNM